MATLSSVNTINVAVALAERQVQRDQSQVQEDSDRLDQSQTQLVHDQRQLVSTQQQDRVAQTAPAAPSVPAAQLEAVAVPPAPSKPQINTQGQTIGRLINVVA